MSGKGEIMPYSILVYWFVAAWLALIAMPVSAQACTTGSETRVIAFETTGGGCPAIAGFYHGPLFPAGAPAPLDRFCSYGSTIRSWADFQASAPLTLVDEAQDCLVTMPQQLAPAAPVALEMAEAMAPELAARYRADVQAAQPGEARVRVEVPDTLPAHEPEDALSSHGPGMVALARLAAGTERAVSARLALGRVAPGELDPVLGGHVGTVGDLARALYDAVDAKDPHESLVINLSLGWQPGVLGGLAHIDPPLSARVLDPNDNQETGLAGPVRAVHAMLGRAACADTLVVAAAGNTEAGADAGQGALLPAAWQAIDVTCGGRSGPMVLAVGGVRVDGQPIANARAGAEPPVVLVAADAVVATDAGFTWSMTGTSVATAVLSGIAARAWTNGPGLDRFDVIGQLMNAGTPLGRPASLCLAGGGCPQVRRLDVCHIAGRCASPTPHDDVRLARLVDDMAERSAELSVRGALQPAAPSTDPSLLDGLSVGPQPGTPVCPSCPARVFGGSMVAWVTLALPVTAPRIAAVDRFNQTIKTMPLPSAVSVGKLSIVTVSGLPAGAVRYRIEGKHNGAWLSSPLKTF